MNNAKNSLRNIVYKFVQIVEETLNDSELNEKQIKKKVNVLDKFLRDFDNIKVGRNFQNSVIKLASKALRRLPEKKINFPKIMIDNGKEREEIELSESSQIRTIGSRLFINDTEGVQIKNFNSFTIVNMEKDYKIGWKDLSEFLDTLESQTKDINEQSKEGQKVFEIFRSN